MTVLVLEASTSSAKAMVYDKERGVLAEHTIPYGSSVGDVYAQDAAEVFEAVLKAGRKTAAGFDVDAMSIVGAWHTILRCDQHMDPIGKVYTWASLDASDIAARLRKDESFTRHVYESTGCMVHALYPVLKLFYLKENGLLSENCLFTELGSYIFFRLTGERLSTVCLLSGSGFFSYKEWDIDSLILERLGLGRAQFGALAGHEDVRPLTAGMANRLGIKAGIPVVPAMPDGGMNQVGSGALSGGVMTLSVGSSAALRLSCDHPVTSPERETWCYRAPGTYLCGAATQGATSSVDWFAKNVAAGRFSYRELDKAAQFAEDAPVFLPFLFGERCPGWQDDRSGGFFGVTGSHTYRELYYAVLEGVLMNIFQCYQALCKLAGSPKEIRVSGGILKSPVWTRMLCDVLGRKIFISKNEQASLLGGAVLALHAAGDWPDITQVPAQGHIFAPDAGKREFYEYRFRRYLGYYHQSGKERLL